MSRNSSAGKKQDVVPYDIVFERPLHGKSLFPFFRVVAQRAPYGRVIQSGKYASPKQVDPG
jgi:hypothetical protein